MGGMRSGYKIFIIKAEGKRPHGRLRHEWEENVQMDFVEMGGEGVASNTQQFFITYTTNYPLG
jgi:hypothetical protein